MAGTFVSTIILSLQEPAGHYGACLGTARGGCALPGAGCGAVYLHHAENESQNESDNRLILKQLFEVFY